MATFTNLNVISFFISGFVLLLSLLIFYQPVYVYRETKKESRFLYIAIPSSPNNTNERQSLRDTWLQLLPDSSYSYKFILGKNMCDVHPDDRVSIYSCERLHISIPEGTTKNTVIYPSHYNSSGVQVKTGYGFSFFVHHAIIIRSLGMMKKTLNMVDGKLARVILYLMPVLNTSDAELYTRLSSVTFHRDFVSEDSDKEGYVYKKLYPPVLLPGGFEGMIRVEGVNEISLEGSCTKVTNWKHGNLFTVLNLYTKDFFEPYKNHFCMVPAVGFTIKDIEELKMHLNGTEQRSVEWKNYIDKIKKQVDEESAQHQDILFLDMIDVYRTLPQKMLLFFKWLFENYNVKYVLKTDDDTFIDILKVSKELQKPGQWDWWSCFHVKSAVYRFGKWREIAYKKNYYPIFPSGAGYVLSERPLMWIKNRLEVLSVAYQGEDVALGIWLEGMNLTWHYSEACYWACSNQCVPEYCNVMQLYVGDVYRMWGDYRNCDNSICNCI